MSDSIWRQDVSGSNRPNECNKVKRATFRRQPSKLKSEKEVKSLSRVRLFATPWTVAHQAPQSKGFSRQQYWSGWPFPSPGDLPDPGVEPRSPALRAGSLLTEPPGKPPQAETPVTVTKDGITRKSEDWGAWGGGGAV